MMRSLKAIVIIISLFISSFFINVCKAEEVHVKGYISDAETYSIAQGDAGGAGTGNNARIQDGDITAFCVDPGYNDAANIESCNRSDITGSKAGQQFASLFSQAKASGSSEGELANATRIIANANGIGTVDEHAGSTQKVYNAASKALKGGKTDYKFADGGGYSLAKSAWDSSSSFKNSGVSFKLNKGKLTVTNNSGKEARLGGLDIFNGDTLVNGDSKTYDVAGSASDCGTPKVPQASYPSSGPTCNKVYQYECGQGSTQNFVGCGEMAEPDENGNTTQQMDNGNAQTISCTPPDDGDCPFDPSDFVDIPTPAGAYQADVLCDYAGSTAFIEQASGVADGYVDECALGESGTKYNYNAPGDSGPYCEMYCTEDYEFNTNSANLSIPDSQLPVTSGSYFNLPENPDDPIKIQDKVTITCYTKNNMYYVMKDILDKYAKHGAEYNKYYKKDTVCNYHPDTCSCGENCTYDCSYYTMDTKEEYYEANMDNNFHITFDKKTPTSSSGKLNSCQPEEHILEHEEMNPPKYEQIASVASANEIKDFNDGCVDIADEVAGFMEECNKEVYFDYYDGKKTIGTPLKFEATDITPSDGGGGNGDQKYCPEDGTYVGGKNFDECNQSKKEEPIYIQGKQTGNIQKTANVSATATKITEYTLEQWQIGNNYNSGERDFSGTGDGHTSFKGWPVDYSTPQGQYRYKFEIKGIKSCLNTGYLDSAINTDEYDINCIYDVNGCDSCRWWCDETSNPEACEGHPCNNSCIFRCLGSGCIYDSRGGLALNYQPISLINIDAAFAFLNEKYSEVLVVNNRKQELEQKRINSQTASQMASFTVGTDNGSQNWNESNPKAKKILDKYRQDGENIYAGEPEYKITLKSQAIGQIKTYNESNGNNFTTNNLSCTNAGNNYVICKSKFLREILPGYQGATVDFKEDNELFKSAMDEGLISSPKKATSTQKNSGPAWK